MQLGVCTNISSNTARGQNVEAIPEFVCLGSVLSSEGRCTGDRLHCIGLTASAMRSLQTLWRQLQHIKLETSLTKLAFYQ